MVYMLITILIEVYGCLQLADGHGGNKAMEGQNTTCTVLQQMLDKGRVASNQGHTPMTAEAMCDGIGIFHT